MITLIEIIIVTMVITIIMIIIVIIKYQNVTFHINYSDI